MSDLLSNLAARSRGISAGIRPRVPALYEPHQRHSGLLGARSQFQEISHNPHREMEVAPFDRALEPSPESSLDPSTERVSNPPWQTTPPSNSPEPLADSRLEPTPIPRFSRTTPPASSEPTFSPMRAAGFDATHPRRTSNSEDKTSQEYSAGMLAETRSGHQLQPARFPAITASQSPDPAATSVELTPRANSPSMVSRRHASSLPQNSQRELQQADSNRAVGPLLDSVHQESNPPRSSSDAEPGSSIHPATRIDAATTQSIAAHPALTPRPADSKAPPATGLAANASSEPSIRVTIGRVEVRAVFPPPPVNRTPPQRSRPTMSLDEYLKRGSGAGR